MSDVLDVLDAPCDMSIASNIGPICEMKQHFQINVRLVLQVKFLSSTWSAIKIMLVFSTKALNYKTYKTLEIS